MADPFIFCTVQEPVNPKEATDKVNGGCSSSKRARSEVDTKLHKPWANALILKIMRRTHTLNFMTQKLQQKWTLIGHWQLTDLDDKYYIARFQMKEDMDAVLTGGPWIITNKYLVVQRWKPNFVPGDEVIQNMHVWIRLTKIFMEWMDVELLWNIRGMLGSTCKVDPITVMQTRGRYVRLCVEIDISKPFRGTLIIDGRPIHVEYENLGTICFNCRCYGNNRK
ncbi:hypothetical protein ACOSQ3_004712 [Xanthoceras sorbifolium]